MHDRVTHRKAAALAAVFGIASAMCVAAETPPAKAADDPKATEQWEPEPPVVSPGVTDSAPPSDAIVLFDGHNLDQWVSTNEHTPARWKVADGVITVDKSAGNIETRQSFRNYQLHLEWRIPKNVTGEGQERGNSGVFLASTGPGDAGYEIQIMDSYKNKTYVNGQAASVYKQSAPLVNAARAPGDWQSYDIIWTAPTFAADGAAQNPGLCHRVPRRGVGTGSFPSDRRDHQPRQAQIQAVPGSPDQTAGPRRSLATDQLPQHLGAQTGLEIAFLQRALRQADFQPWGREVEKSAHLERQEPPSGVDEAYG